MPLDIQLCETDSLTGQCLGPPAAGVLTSMSYGSARSFAVFVTATGTVPLDPADHRVFVRFTDPGGAMRGLASVAVQVTGSRSVTALGPARLWIGLRNSDAVGLRADLLVEVFAADVEIGQGQLGNAATGSSGFNNARLHTVPLDLVNGPVDIAPGTELVVRVSVRRTCSGGGHASGTVRLWYDGQAIDSGKARDAGTRFGATIDGEEVDYFLRDGWALRPVAGASRRFIDATVGSADSCPDRPYVAFGVWSVAPYYYGAALLGPVRPMYALASLGFVIALVVSQVVSRRRRR